MIYNGDVNKLIKGKYFKDLEITDKQKVELKKVIDFLNSEKNENECILKKQATFKILPSMVKSGVDDLYVRRLIRKNKYCKVKVDLYGMLILYGRKGYEYWDDYKNKQAKTNTYEYKKDKYGWTKEKFEKYNKSRAVTLENLEKKHGKKEGLEIWNRYREKQRYSNTLEYYVERYGEKCGYDEWIKYNRSKSHSIDSYIKKYGEETGKKRYIDFWNNRHRGYYSKISQELFWSIYKNLSLKDKNNTYFATLNKEFGKMNEKTKQYYFYDFVITSRNICIEFNGDDWHANPKRYMPEDVPNVYKNIECDVKSKDIWKKDEIKNNLLKEVGYDIIVVWESDYKNNPDETIKKCTERIYNE